MKHLLLIILLTTVSIYGQDVDNYFSGAFGVDMKNAYMGSKPTNNERAIDWTLEAHSVVENLDFGVGYENFNRINYDRKWVGIGYHYKIVYIAGTNIKFSAQPSIEMSWIGREWYDEGTERRTFFTPSLNVNWNWDLSRHFAVAIATNWLPRPDVRVIYHQQHNKYVLSEGLKIVYKFKND